MLIPAETVESLRAGLQGPSEELRVAWAPLELDPLELVRAGAGSFATAVFLGSPGGEEVGGLGSAHRAVGSPGPGRLAPVEALELPGPHRLLFGFSFSEEGPQGEEWDGFPAALGVLPRVTAARGPAGGTIGVAIPPGEEPEDTLRLLGELLPPPPPSLPDAADHVLEAHPAPGSWRQGVAEALGAIEAAMLEKVVLARAVEVRWSGGARPFDLVRHLREAYPSCHAFGWQEGKATFLGATPELLVARRGAEVGSRPLAGSAPRGEGEEEDRRLGEMLLASEKDLAEHALVVEDVAARLRPLTRELWVSPRPSLRKMATVQHLSSEVGGLLSSPRSVVSLAGELHPTPAVAGTPRQDALGFIAKVEAIDRGWYAGGIGWVDEDGDGEAVIPLRCALVLGSSAHLYAGAGIVAGSEPEAELAETRLKLRPLLELLAAP